MISVVINDLEIFEILKSEKFIIGIASLSRFTKLIESKIEFLIINPLPVELKKKLVCKFTLLRFDWKSLQGGRPRFNFIQNLKEKETCINDINKYVESSNEIDTALSKNASLDQVSSKEHSLDQEAASDTNSLDNYQLYELSSQKEKKVFY